MSHPRCPAPPTCRDALALAARLALRGFGRAEPNPLVGAVLVKDGRIVGLGHHARFGGPHAEREALASARRQGFDPRGSTLYVTLEPCRHHGKQPPCTDAILEAGVSRVVYARADTNSVAAGGAGILRDAGVEAVLDESSLIAACVGLPFAHRTATGRPFVIAKWAQSLDGRLATGAGDSRWISGESSRRRVHLLRGRVDAIVTGIGTVLADDPLLTARSVRARRTARRVVIDPRLRTPVGSRLVATARDVPLVILAAERRMETPEAGALRRAGAEVVGMPESGAGLDLAACLVELASRFGVATCLLEAGPRLLGAFRDAGLVDAAIAYIAPLFIGGAGAPVPGPDLVADAPRWRLVRARRCGGDVELTLLPPPGR